MVEIAPGETIVSRQAKILLSRGIREIVVTTGPFAGLLQRYLEELFPAARFTFVHNSRYAETNNIWSLLLAKAYMRGEFLLLHGDLVFDAVLVDRTLAAAFADTVLVGPAEPLPAKDFKAQLAGGLVRRISVRLSGADCRFLIPFYKISLPLWRRWLAAMEEFAARGELSVYAEEALNRLLPTHPLHPVPFTTELCREIDTPADLAAVRAQLAAGKEDGA